LTLAALVRGLPRRAVSRALGRVGRIELPPALLAPILRLYARRYGARTEEAEVPPGGWRSFNAFFTRRLLPGARPLDPDPRAILSPADARVVASGRVDRGTMLQAKGVPYALADLVGSPEDARRLEGGAYVVLYLAPGDYHRFHWPLDGRFLLLRHLPGDLWPVNAAAVGSVPRLFVRNERVALRGETDGGAEFAFVAIGALNVGSIRLCFHSARTNRGGPARPRSFALADARGRRGEELGRFEFGSSIAVVLGPETGEFAALEPGRRVRVGERIGTRGRA
jgi:phosphatidylserine decarboxylase